MTGARHDGTGACRCGMTSSGRTLDAGCPAQAHTAGLIAVAFSPCGQRLATGGQDKSVILWDAHTGKGAQHWRGQGSCAISLCFSADGARLASASFDEKIRVWDTATGALLRTIEASAVRSVHFSPTDNKVLASAGQTDSIVWDVDSGERTRIIAGRHFAVFSPDGRTVATSSVGNVMLLVDAGSRAVRSRMDHTSPVFPSSFSVDGSKLATGCYDGTCKVWDSSTGALLRTIEVGSTIFSVFWGRDWVMDTQRAMAFAMGHHPRLGERSQVLALDAGVVRMILDRV
mmetsp:Transcript_63019/g.144384  ORF Transcript_63019/g.144384 Transcript_63019/m.144384 type:complete len:287 (+) Transcript_63019:315-1175(+)